MASTEDFPSLVDFTLIQSPLTFSIVTFSKFPFLLILDTLEGVLPQNLKYDPILPFDIKHILKMRTYLDWEKLFSYNFFTLIASSNSTNIFWPERQVEMERNERSRFVERIIVNAHG